MFTKNRPNRRFLVLEIRLIYKGLKTVILFVLEPVYFKRPILSGL
jgi:hypothetical protein